MRKIRFVDLASQYQRLKEELESVIRRSMASSQYILGEEVELFEQEFARYCGVKYCVGLDNGSSALELGLRALGIGPGDEVITPVNSFIASSSAISFVGATPVWVDCDPQTYNIDTTKIEKKISKRTKAIMPVHLYGQVADMDHITEIAKKHKLFIVEDACQAHGAEYKGKRAGSFGALAAYSFYPGKNLGAYGDAGAIVTNSKHIYQNVKAMRNYGQSKKYHHDVLAWNRRLDTIQAAILRIKLKYLDRWNAKRREYAAIYNNLLQHLPVITPGEATFPQHVFHVYAIRTKKRDKLLSFLRDHGIEAGIHYPIPIHRQHAYKFLVRKHEAYPIAEQYAREFLSLPMHPELTKQDLEYVARTIRRFFA